MDEEEKTQRKASDILLELETKIDKLISLYSTQDLNIKTLSNKFNAVLVAVKEQGIKQLMPIQKNGLVPTMEVFSERAIPITTENTTLTMEDPSKVPRRTSRQNSIESSSIKNEYPIQISTMKQKKEILLNPIEEIKFEEYEEEKKPKEQNENNFPIIQKVTDKNGKAIFIADVEIIDEATMNQIFKTRTNGAGKWMAALPIGNYKIFIKKRESLTKEKMELEQSIKIDGSESRVELKTVIIK